MSRGKIWDPVLKECILNDYFAGSKTVAELSSISGVPAKTISQWAWLKQKECREKGIEPPKRTVRHKGGAPIGNKNAVGSKGPAGLQNAKKHGAYASVILGELDPDEQKIIEAIPDDPEEHLKEEIRLLTIRERRILKAIEKYSSQELYLKYRTSKTQLKKEECQEEGADHCKDIEQYEENNSGNATVISTEWCSIELIIRLEHELTTVQIAIREALIALENMRRPAEVTALQIKSKKLEIELLDARIEQIDAKTASLTNQLAIEDLSETDALIYGSGNETV